MGALLPEGGPGDYKTDKIIMYDEGASGNANEKKQNP
jgi:hypothetical protein